MVATAPGEKLLIGRRPVGIWTQLQFITFILRKISKKTELHFLTPVCTKSFVGWGFTPDGQTPLRGANSAPPDPLAVWRGQDRKGTGGEGREGEGERMRGEGRRGEDRGGREFVLCPSKKKEKSAPICTVCILINKTSAVTRRTAYVMSLIEEDILYTDNRQLFTRCLHFTTAVVCSRLYYCGCVDTRQYIDEFKKKTIFIYLSLFILPSVAYDPEG